MVALAAVYCGVGWVERDSNLDALRELPRFAGLVARLRAKP